MHMCEIFIAQELPCPFRFLEEDDEEESEFEPARLPRIAIPGRRNESRVNRANNVVEVFINQLSSVDAVGKLKGIEKELQPAGGMRQLIPRLTGKLEGLPAMGREGAFAAAAAVALSEVLRRSSGGNLSPFGLQRQVAGAFGRQDLGTSARGRGGFNVNAAAELKGLFGGRRRRKVGQDSGFGEFTLAGLGDSI